jgi:hypothetical protein
MLSHVATRMFQDHAELGMTLACDKTLIQRKVSRVILENYTYVVNTRGPSEADKGRQL